MIQRIGVIALIVIIVIGGGVYAYKGLVPPPQEEAQGPVYSTKPVTRGDISVGVEATGPLNPSRSGGIQAPGSYRDAETSSIQYTIVELLAEEGEEVKMGQVIARLEAPALETRLKNLQDEINVEKRLLSEMTGVSSGDIYNINPAQGVTISAPIDGRITGLDIYEGEEIKQGHIVARVVDDSKYEINAKLYPHEFALVKEGQELAVRFSIFDGTYYGQVAEVNPNPFPDNDENNPAKGFVYWIKVQGDNPGLVRPGVDVRIGIPSEDLDDLKVMWFKNSAKVDGFVNEERVLSTVEAVATRVYVKEMDVVKKGDPLVSLAGTDVQQLIQERLDKIRNKELELSQLLATTGQSEVRAPMDGVVARWEQQPGAVVRPGDWMGYVYNTSDMRMWVQVDDIDVLLVQQGAPVKVTIDALPGEEFEGEVMQVATMGQDVNGIPQFGVDISVKGGANLRPGMQAHAYIGAGSANDVLLIPVEAIFEEDGSPKVEILNEDGTTKVVSVKIGLMNDNVAEVKSGVNEGDLVITGSSADVLPSQNIGSKESILPQEDNRDEGNSSNNATTNLIRREEYK
jgi:HlyD family secretion protein